MKTKRTIALFLVILTVMNTVGYYGLLVIVRDQVAIASVDRIQSTINEPGANLIIKVPVAVPYVTHSEADFVSESHFTHEGQVYRTIRQRLYKDTLYLVCIHDDRTTKADHNVSDFAKSFAGDEDTQGTAVKFISLFAKYFVEPSPKLRSVQSAWVLEQAYSEYVSFYLQDLAIPVFQPPKQLA